MELKCTTRGFPAERAAAANRARAPSLISAALPMKQLTTASIPSSARSSAASPAAASPGLGLAQSVASSCTTTRRPMKLSAPSPRTRCCMLWTRKRHGLARRPARVRRARFARASHEPRDVGDGARRAHLILAQSNAERLFYGDQQPHRARFGPRGDLRRPILRAGQRGEPEDAHDDGCDRAAERSGGLAADDAGGHTAYHGAPGDDAGDGAAAHDAGAIADARPAQHGNARADSYVSSDFDGRAAARG